MFLSFKVLKYSYARRPDAIDYNVVFLETNLMTKCNGFIAIINTSGSRRIQVLLLTCSLSDLNDGLFVIQKQEASHSVICGSISFMHRLIATKSIFITHDFDKLPLTFFFFCLLKF